MITFSSYEILERLPSVYICWKDENSVFLGCNQNFADLLGKTKSEIIGTQDTIEKHKLDDEKVRNSGQEIIGMIETISATVLGTLQICTNKAPLKSKEGKTVGTIVIFTKLTT
ncbi:MAG: hypothetical protein S4CHLAM6_13690 [Chlamydiae bacterium]|nr:hypothetical protein [Chlamydiota bacterium]